MLILTSPRRVLGASFSSSKHQDHLNPSIFIIMKALAPLRMLERMRSYGASQRIEWLKVFPDELWIMIITSTPTETLKALALTCHELSGECRRELARRKAQELEQLRLLEFVFHTKVICHSW